MSDSLCYFAKPIREIYLIRHYNQPEKILRQVVFLRRENSEELPQCNPYKDNNGEYIESVGYDELENILSADILSNMPINKDMSILIVNLSIENDETISTILDKMSLITGNFSPDDIYLWYEDEDIKKPLTHYFTIKEKVGPKKTIDKAVAFEPNPYTQIAENQGVPGLFATTELFPTRQSTKSMIIKEFNLPINVVNLTTTFDLVKYWKDETDIDIISSKTMSSLLAMYFNYNMDRGSNLVAIENSTRLLGNIQHDDEEVKDRIRILSAEVLQVDQIRGNHLDAVRNPEYLVNDKNIDPEIMDEEIEPYINIGKCGLGEMVINVNFETEFEPFIDLNKIFNMFPLSVHVPFVKIKEERVVEPRYKVHDSLVDKAKHPNTYVEPKVIREWLLNVRRRDIRYVEGAVGRMLTFKIYHARNKKTGDKKYVTLNIYNDGKLEIKSSWFHGQQGKLSDVQTMIKRAKYVIDNINKLQFHLPRIDRTLKIISPDPNFLNNQNNSNTKIGFLNGSIPITYKQDEMLSFENLYEYGNLFTSFISLVPNHIRPIRDADGNITQQVTTPRNFEFRYKRINNFQHLKTIEKYIKDIGRSKEVAILSKTDLTNLIATNLSEKFNIPETDARKVFKIYLNQHGDPRGKSEDEIIADTVEHEGAVIGYDIRKQPGIDLKLLPDEQNPHLYHLNFIGVNLQQLGYIYHFIRSFFHSFVSETLRNIFENTVVVDNERIGKEAVHDAMIGNYDFDEITAGILADLNQETDVGQQDSEDDEITPDEDRKLPERPKKPEIKPFNLDAKTKITPLRVVQKYLKDRLKKYSDIKGKEYAKTCQSSADKVPILADPNRIEQIKQEQYNLLEKLKLRRDEEWDELDENEQIQLDNDILASKYNIKAIENGHVLDGNHGKRFAFCPVAWSFRDETILPYSEAKERALTDKTVYAIKPEKLPKRTYVLSFSEDEACIPCCYLKKSARHNQKIKKCTENKEITTIGPVSQTQNYVLMEHKRGLESGRYALLPPILNNILNAGQDCPTTIDSATYNCFLRKGVSSRGNALFNALAVFAGFKDDTGDRNDPNFRMAGEKLLDELIYYLENEDKRHKFFIGCKNGILPTIFSQIKPDEVARQIGDLDPQSPELERNVKKIYIENLKNAKKRFIEYMIDNYETLDEDFVWDLFSRTDIISGKSVDSEGVEKPGQRVNLVIFESAGRMDKPFDDIVLKCPVGSDVDQLYDTGGKNPRANIILLKYAGNYEIILRRERNKEHLSLPDGDPIMVRIIERLKTCRPRKDQIVESELSQFKKNYIHRGVVDRLNTMLQLTSATLPSAVNVYKKIFSKLRKYPDYQVKGQILDEYYKTIYLILGNGVIIPTDPSGLIITGAFGYSFYPSYKAKDYATVLSTLRIVNDIVTIACKPIFHVYYREDPEDELRIFGFMTNSGNIVEISPKIKQSDIPENVEITYPIPDRNTDTLTRRQILNQYELSSVYRKLQILEVNPFELNKSIYLKISENDERTITVNTDQFEHESYQRFRFEMSKWLQTDKGREFKDTLTEILEQKTGNGLSKQRENISQVLFEIYERLTTNELPELLINENGELDLTKYTIPVIRYECFNRSLDAYRGKDYHCSDGKLYINPVNLTNDKNNKIMFVSLMTEELLRSPYKRVEIMDNQMDNFVDMIPIVRDDENLISLLAGDFESTYEMLANIYETRKQEDNVTYRRKMMQHYDVYNVWNEDEGVQRRHVTPPSINPFDQCSGQMKPLPQKWLTEFKHSTLFYIPNISNTCIYLNIAKAVNQMNVDEEHNVKSIKELVESRLRIMSKEELTPFVKFNKLFNSKELKNIKSRTTFMNYYMSGLHKMTILELFILGKILDIQFIAISRKKISCLGVKTSYKTRYALIWYTSPNHLELIVDTSHSPPKAIFDSENIPSELFRMAIGKCSELKPESKILTEYEPIFEKYFKQYHEEVVKKRKERAQRRGNQSRPVQSVEGPVQSGIVGTDENK